MNASADIEEEETAEETAAAELAAEIVERAVPLIATLSQLTKEQAANQLVMAVISYAHTSLEGPLDEPLATEVSVLREMSGH